MSGPRARTGFSVVNPRVDAELRRLAANVTKRLAGRYGSRLGMWFGAGYPRSGTTYLCHLMASYLDIPFVRHYRLPALMPCVVHSHWLPGRQVPPTIYVVRDGRDVIVSRYFYEVRSIASSRNPRGAARRRQRFARLYGRGADLSDATANLPAFIDAEMTRPLLTGVSWPEHVRQWLAMPPEQVAIVRYEDLVADVAGTLAPAFEALARRPVDRDYLRLAGRRFDQDWQRRRDVEWGEECVRSGPAGSRWRTYFDADSTELFQRYAGDELERLGYSPDDSSHPAR